MRICCLSTDGMATAASLLAKVDTAIEKILDGTADSYSIGARTYTALDIKDLFRMRQQLELQANRDANGAMRLAKIGRISR